MKKALLLLASAVLLLAGCAKEQIGAGENEGGLVEATFTASLESGVATKADIDTDGKGAYVNRCIMEIYFQDQLYKRLVKPLTGEVGSLTATFANVPVVAGKQYKILFWADCGGAEKADLYYTTTNLKTVTVAKTAFLAALAAGENDKLDAFYFADNYTISQNQTEVNAVVLKRPFAQLNIITTDVGTGKTVFKEDLLPQKVYVSYEAANTINVATGEISKVGNNAEDYTFTYEASVYGPWGTITAQHPELTLSMDYVLASTEQGAIDVTFKTFNDGEDPVMTHNLTNLPYKRNYRTNVKGELLTVGGTWTATVNSNWTGENPVNFKEVENISALNTSLAAGANNLKVNLPSDSDGTNVTFTSTNDPQDVILDFVGNLGSNKTLTFVNASGATGPKSLNITAPTGTKLVFEQQQNHVVINGTSYASVQGAFSANTLIISKDVTVGTLTITAGGLEIHGAVTAINANELTGNVKVRACEGLSSTVYAALQSHIDTPKYKAVQNGEKWDIVAADKVATIGDVVYYRLQDAITDAQSGNEIKLLIDLENAGTNNLPAGVSFNGCGHKITGASALYINANGGVVKNVVFENIHNGTNKQSPIYAYSLAGRAEISGCTFDDCDWDAIQITTNSANADIVIKDNEFKAVAKDTKQQRFIHIQTDEYSNVDLKAAITGNKFSGIYNLQNTAIELYCPTDFNNVNISGNYLDGNKISVCIANRDGSAWVNHIESAKNWLDANGQPVAINAAIRADVDCENTLLCTTLAVALQESASWSGSLCIMNEAALRELSTLVNDGKTFEGKTVALVNDVDLRNVAWTPIGNVNSYPSITFYGTFDGKNHTISNLTCTDNTPNHACAGLFGSLMGTVKNVILTNVDIKSSHYAGGICAYSSSSGSKVENCKVIGGTITSAPEWLGSEYDNGDKAGGIFGLNSEGGSITGCTVENLTIHAYRDLGGIAGTSRGIISNNTVKNTSIIQDNTNGYKSSVDTYAEILGSNLGCTLTDNTFENVTVQSLIADGLVYTKNEKLYEISKVAGLTYFRDMVTGGKDFAGETVKLLENLDLASIDNYQGTKGKFSGTFDGNGKTISNLKISDTTNSTAFFGSVWDADIKNLTITGAEVTSSGADYTGILAGNGYAHFDNCTISGTVSGVEQVGAVIGYLSCGYIKNCTADAAVSGTSRVGVLCAKANVDSQYNIEGNTIKGSATSNDLYAGGVVGQIMCGTGKVWTIKNNSIDATVSAGGSLIGNVRSGNWEAFVAGYQTNVTGNTWTAEGNCMISDGTNSVEITK